MAGNQAFSSHCLPGCTEARSWTQECTWDCIPGTPLLAVGVPNSILTPVSHALGALSYLCNSVFPDFSHLQLLFVCLEQLVQAEQRLPSIAQNANPRPLGALPPGILGVLPEPSLRRILGKTP